MPYINETRRKNLDNAINGLILALKTNLSDSTSPFDKESISNDDVVNLCGDMNYCFSRIIGHFMASNPSYGKIAIITGVLENIKQEFYRRAAASLEDQKIRQNGDIPEYRKLS